MRPFHVSDQEPRFRSNNSTGSSEKHKHTNNYMALLLTNIGLLTLGFGLMRHEHITSDMFKTYYWLIGCILLTRRRPVYAEARLPTGQ
jgi:hypothetical protein